MKIIFSKEIFILGHHLVDGLDIELFQKISSHAYFINFEISEMILRNILPNPFHSGQNKIDGKKQCFSAISPKDDLRNSTDIIV